MVIDKINGFILRADSEGANFYQVVYPSGRTMVNTSGTKEEVIKELKRLCAGVDAKNSFKLEINNSFIETLENLSKVESP